ncbi:MAG: hypothetical protein JNM81_05295 [Rhodospirillaceae bacterium]|nr:hypothetical protein [Rhodospirillaceae bacterium]
MKDKMKLIRTVVCAVALLSGFNVSQAASTEAANDDVYVIPNPEQYLVARGPAKPIVLESVKPARASASPSETIEKAAAVIPGSYTVIPNVTPGLNSNLSFLRFPNFNTDVASTANIKMVGDATGTDYGTAQVVSQPNSSPQITVLELLQSIEGTSFAASDTSLTLYIQSNQYLTGIQHVYYNSSSGFFENMSVCSFVDGISSLPTASGVVNVHTTKLQTQYPSVVKIHNKNSTATTLTLRVHDGPSGTLIKKFSFLAQPNSTYAFTSAQIQSNVGFTPGTDDYHMNIFFDAPAEAPPNATISHTVGNGALASATLNLTTICTIND